jgi:ribosomal protein S18 acetylase RimI-like enzyme
MSCTYNLLTETSFDGIYQTFVEAFSDYAIDLSYMTRESLFNRFIKNGIDFSCSVGAFDDNKLIGYMLVGLDNWNNEPAAFLIGTGIIRPYRGQGIATDMFNIVIPELRSRGIRRFLLEVLQQNEQAIRAYKKVGFSINRSFDCFHLKTGNIRLDEDVPDAISFRILGKDDMSQFTDSLDRLPSWENSFSSIRRIPDKLCIFGAEYNGDLAGLLVYYPGLSWITGLAVKKNYRHKRIAVALIKYLLQKIQDKTPLIRIVNIDTTDKGMISFLDSMGFKCYVSQYEMELVL